MITSCILVLSLGFVQGQASVKPQDDCQSSAAEFPPPPLPPCSGIWDWQCVTRCIFTYSSNMQGAADLHCENEQQAYINFDVMAAICATTFDKCVASGAPTEWCQYDLDLCLNDITKRLAKDLAANDAQHDENVAAINAGWVTCALACCIND